ncbi:MAG: hypothetical protein L6R36_003199 [Xanthoria steineri]|nr:MAG: hypothetical protein L6R36_003199 [Xanthoria steineri]
MEASLLSPPDPSKRRSTVSEWSADADAESHRSWTRNHDDEFQLNLLRPWSITSHPSVRSRSSTVTDTQYASASAVDPDDASTKGLLSSGTWARFGRRSRDAADDVDNPGAQFAYGGPGWWKHQMLSDRSFRTMAAVTTIFAFIMSVICIAYLKDLTHRPNKNSTSVGGKADKTCSSMEGRNVMIHLVINVAATMILGMSNTYQQLITSLSTKELRWVLSKHEDSRVGTNSPFNINHKQHGKLQAWAQWILLIGTSLPVHFLANSVIGPSVYHQPPRDITFDQMAELGSSDRYSYNSTVKYRHFLESEKPGDRACWLAFRTGNYSISQSPTKARYGYASELDDWLSGSVAVSYTEPCAQYRETTTIQDMRGKEINTDFSGEKPTLFSIGDCGFGRDVACDMGPSNKHDQGDGEVGKEKCRLSVRMSAAIILAGCLIVKAVYMVTIVLRGRKRIKTKCLAFGDVIAASVLDPSLQIKNECMVNAFDGHRHLVQHTCHPKHCRSGVEPSMTGDGIGHCQKCKKFNEINYAGDLLHPSIAIKYKKSLIANLGVNAVAQMAILMLSSVAMFGISIMLAVFVGFAAKNFQYECSQDDKYGWEETCKKGQSHYLKYKFGYFGGFDTAAPLGRLGMNSINSEVTAFAISNGAQLLYSLIYLLLIYNFTLISMEHDWGRLERVRDRLRCTLVEGEGFKQSYLLQLPKNLLYPMMVFSSLMHWLLGQSISTKETIWSDDTDGSNPVEFSRYDIVFGAYAIWLSTLLMLMQTGICWWAFTYSREGFMPQMYGSIRACCAATTQLTTFPQAGIQWGDLGKGEKFRHAGFSSDVVEEIVPAELYSGLDSEESDVKRIKEFSQERDGLKRRMFGSDPDEYR